MQTKTSNQHFKTAEIAEVITDITNGNRSLFSKKAFCKDDIISAFDWDIVYESPNYLTVQIADNKHIILQPSFLECINHSCAPNAFFDTTKKELICVKPIAIGEEITFFYPSAEWDMDQAIVVQATVLVLYKVQSIYKKKLWNNINLPILYNKS
jgi:SET domain